MKSRKKMIVMKFGGKCLETKELILAVAGYLKEYLETFPDYKIVAVVSARGKFTDETLNLIQQLAPSLYTDSEKSISREIDMATQSGEVISASLLACALLEMKVKTRSLNALQLGIETTGTYTQGKITDIDVSKLNKFLKDNDVLVVTGFQGVHEKEKDSIVTLGRGGSDKTAVAIAAKLKCKCEFYKKAKGITVFDPEISGTAKVLDFMTYREAQILSAYGYHFLQPECLEMAQKYLVLLEFKASPGLGNDPWERSTVIGERFACIEASKRTFKAIAVKSNVSLITINNVPNEMGWSEKIFALFQNINLLDFQQIIIQDKAAFSLTMEDSDYMKVADTFMVNIRELSPEIICHWENSLANITFIDSNMRLTSGYAYLIGKLLNQAGVNIEGQYTSEDKIHTLVKIDKKVDAVLALAQHFDLLAKK